MMPWISRVLTFAVLAAMTSSVSTAAAESAGLTADFNRDHAVDSLDLLKWNANYGPTAAADANGDSATDGMDFLAWQRQLGSVDSANVEVSSNPEPAAIVVWSALAVAACAVVAFRRRRNPALEFAAIG
jgi:hypothetical protein